MTKFFSSFKRRLSIIGNNNYIIYMKNTNQYPTVVTSPTRYKGGMNAPVTVETNPTRYKGGMNSPVTVQATPTPYKGGTNGSNMKDKVK
jgi:hypothetical protein